MNKFCLVLICALAFPLAKAEAAPKAPKKAAKKPMPARAPQMKAPTLIAVSVASGTAGGVLRSSDGGNSWKLLWDGSMESKSGVNDRSALYAVAQGGGKMVVVGKTLMVSSDGGQSWRETVVKNGAGDNIMGGYNNFRGVAYGDGIFVAAGAIGHILYSGDGENWKYVLDESIKGMPQGSEFPNMNHRNQAVRSPLSVFFHGGKFYVTGGSQAMELAILSKSGNELKVDRVLDLPTEFGNAAVITSGGIIDMAANGNDLVAVTNSQKSVVSRDGGATWKIIRNTVDGSKTQILNTVVYGNGKFIGLTPFRDIGVMTNLSEGWATAPTKMPIVPIRAHFIDGVFYATGEDGEVATSRDGINWTATKSAVRDPGSGFKVQIYDFVKAP